MTYFNRTIISNVVIPHPTLELAHYAWIITKALIVAETLSYLYHSQSKLLILAIAYLLLYVAYKFNEIK